MPSYVLFQYGKIRNEPEDFTIFEGASDIGVTINLYTNVRLEDAEKELQKMQGLENARKEIGLSDKEDNPLKQSMPEKFGSM